MNLSKILDAGMQPQSKSSLKDRVKSLIVSDKIPAEVGKAFQAYWKGATQKTGVVTKGGKKFLGYQVPPFVQVNGVKLKYAGINENGVVMY